ncbi:MAG TPA: S8 family serine peptidase [Chloroflexia bacterium]|nr:S8 family serine peptidase [Chloroflexia bacterium]
MFNPAAAVEKVDCPLCHQTVGPGQFAGPQDIEPAAVNYLQEHHPEWSPELGVCPNCLQAALNDLVAQIEDETRPPVGKPSVYGILPVGLRLGYNGQYNGSGVRIAFLDSGFSAHPDLQDRIKLYVDASNDEIRELSEVELSGDLSWHGTMTSVVACGNGSLSNGLYRGLASGAEVILIRVSNQEGRVNEEGIERGLGWILANWRRFGIQIVNVSLGGDRPTGYANNPVDLMVEALVAQNVLVVCAAGNAGERYLVPPASAPSAITVGGLDDKNTLDPETFELWHSNYGQTRSGVWKPELVAPSLWLAAPVLPGSSVAREAAALERLLAAEPDELLVLLSDEDIQQSINLPADLPGQPPAEIRRHLREAWHSQKLLNQYYQHVDGTSFAAPIVSSVAAQMLQANPKLSAAGLKDLIMRTARYLPEVAPDQQGHGVVDPWAAVAAALATANR